MQTIINSIIASLGGKLGDFLILCAKFAESSVLMINRILDKKEKKEKKEKQQKIEDICNSGSLGDLLQKFNKCISIAIVTLLAGCINAAKVDVVTTNSWEGHFKDETSFKQATKDLSLKKGETIWVLSNHTLNYILQNATNAGK